MCQILAFAQPIKIAHLFDQVRSQHECRKIRELLANPSVHILYAIARAEQGVQPWRQREIREGGDIVIGEIDGILRPSNAEVFYGWDLVACGGQCQSSGQLWSCSSQSVASALFSGRTSEIELALFQGVQVREGGVDEIGSETHDVGWLKATTISRLGDVLTKKKMRRIALNVTDTGCPRQSSLALAQSRVANAHSRGISGWCLSKVPYLSEQRECVVSFGQSKGCWLRFRDPRSSPSAAKAQREFLSSAEPKGLGGNLTDSTICPYHRLLCGARLALYSMTLTNDAPQNPNHRSARRRLMSTTLRSRRCSLSLGKGPVLHRSMITVLVKRRQPFICRNHYVSLCRRSLVVYLSRRRALNAQTVGVGGVV